MHAIWFFSINIAVLIFKIINLIELILSIKIGRNLPVRVHCIEVDQIIINYILSFRENTGMTTL